MNSMERIIIPNSKSFQGKLPTGVHQKHVACTYDEALYHCCDRVKLEAVDPLESLEIGDLLELLDPQETQDPLERMACL